MNLFELFQIGSASLEFFIQSSIPTGGDCGDWILFGSAFNAITAAWATLGYYAQADVLYYMNAGWQGFAILLYTGAGIAGIASMAFGQPPKTWVWFFIGPAVYYFAIDTRQPADGVAWMIGSYVQDQKEVWKQAEAGAVNSGVVRRGVIGFNAEGPSVSGEIEVSVPFLMLDSLVSDTVRQLSTWAGALSQVNPYWDGGAPDSTSTNVALANDAPGYYFGEELDSIEQCQANKVHFSAVSNTKWTYLNSVTQAELGNTDARDAFARFMASECGSHLSESVDFTNFSKALNFKDRDLPESVLFQDTTNPESDYSRLRVNLGKQRVPTPPTLRRLFTETLETTSSSSFGGSSFLRAVDWSPPNNGSPSQCGEAQTQGDIALMESVLSRDLITCDAYLYMLLLYFRYEAALIFSQTFQSSGPTGWYPHDLTYNILYGWDIPFDEECSSAYGMGIRAQTQFVYNLILAHLLRNEMNRLPELVTVGKDKTQAIIDDSQLYNASIGSTSKAAEVYTWSLMIPYVQGILLYLLTMAFPIVCMLMLVPSWMKIIVTWASFFVWVKLWDLGFAFVASLERTLWAQMANSNASRQVNGKILEMSKYGGFWDKECTYSVTFSSGGGTALVSTEACGGYQPILYLTSASSDTCGTNDTCFNVFAESSAAGLDSAFDATLRIFDLGLLVGSSLDFDIANGYYIYIMSALYFAVPAVTGQMVLGAKAGVAGMVDKIAADPAGKAASAAGSSYTGNETARVKQNAATVSQESLAKGHRSSGLVDKALGQQNQAAEHGRLAAYHGQIAEGANRHAQAIASANEYAGAAYQVPKTALTHALAPLKAERAKPPGGGGGDYSVGGGPGEGGNHPEHSASGNSTISSAIKGQSVAAGSAAGDEGFRAMLGRMGKPGSLLATAGGYAGLAGYAGDSVMNIGEAAFNAERTFAVTDSRNQASALAGEQGIMAYGAQQRSSAYRSASERTMAQAQFAAQTAQYDAMNNYSNQRAGRMAVLGVPPGMIGPERRPEDAMGMAMAGMLDAPGRETRRKANFFDPQTGGFFNTINSSEQKLHGEYGYNATRQSFNSGIKSGTDYFGDSLRSGYKAVTEMGMSRALPPESEK